MNSNFPFGHKHYGCDFTNNCGCDGKGGVFMPFYKPKKLRGPCDLCGKTRILKVVVNSVGDVFGICKNCPTDVRWEEK